MMSLHHSATLGTIAVCEPHNSFLRGVAVNDNAFDIDDAIPSNRRSAGIDPLRSGTTGRGPGGKERPLCKHCGESVEVEPPKIN
jgi:hypothetical protein